MNYFEGVKAADMKGHYRKLAQRLHPDRGGDEASFKEMKRQYEYWEKYGTMPSSGSMYSKPEQQPHVRAYKRYYGTSPRGCLIVVQGSLEVNPVTFLKNRFAFADSAGKEWSFDLTGTYNGRWFYVNDLGERLALKLRSRLVMNNLKIHCNLTELDLKKGHNVQVPVYYADVCRVGHITLKDVDEYFELWKQGAKTVSATYKTSRLKLADHFSRHKWDIEGMIEATISLPSEPYIPEAGFWNKCKEAWRIFCGKD